MSEVRIGLRDKLEHRLARLLLSLPASVQLKLSGKPQIVRDGQRLHHQLQLLLAVRALKKAPAFSSLPPQKTRSIMKRDSIVHAGELARVRAIKDLTIDGAEWPLPARHYAPEADGPRPLVVFLHGGGFVLGDLDTYDPVCRLLCRHAHVHVLSVDYRLAPEHPFPAAVEDSLAAFRWAHKNASSLGADPRKVAIAGDSAGGNLSAVIAQLTVRQKERAPSAQLLFYPAVDRSVRRPSLELFSEGFFLTRADIEYFQQHYVGAVGGAHGDPRASPLLHSDLSGLPPALVVTAGFDPLRDEGEAYVEALKKAGTPASLVRYDSLIHGFANFAGVSSACRSAVIDVAKKLRTLLENEGNAS